MLNKECLTSLERELILLLRSIWDDDEFIIGVLNSARTEDDQHAIIEHIETGEGVDSESVQLLSIELYRNRYGEPEYEDD